MKCIFCNDDIYLENKKENRVVQQNKAVESFKNAAKERDDRKLMGLFENIELPFTVHKRCASNYTKSDQIKASFKRQRNNQEGLDGLSPTPPKLRSSVRGYNEKLSCLFCTEEIEIDQSKLPLERRRDYSDFQSLPEDVPKLKEKFKEFDNEFVQEVKSRYDRITTLCSDMPSAEIKYHRNCYSSFLMHGRKLGITEHKSGRPDCPVKSKAFEQLVDYLRNDDESQYSLQEIQHLFASYLSDDETPYTDKWMKKKLQSHFGNDIIITESKKTVLVTFKENAYTILKESWKTKKLNNEEEKLLIIDMAASIIRDSVRSKPYQINEYPDLVNLDPQSINEDIPFELDRFMNGVIKTTSKTSSNVSHRRRAAISHSLISACRPRSFISSLMLSLSIYVYKKYESRILVDILCSLGYAASYEEVILYLDNVSTTPSYVEQLQHLGENAFIQFIFDNADWNRRNDTGKNSWHVMGGIAAVSPCNIIEEKTKIKRCKTNTSSGKSPFIPIIEPPKVIKNLPLPKTKFKPLPPTCMSPNGSTVSGLSNLWMLLSSGDCLNRIYDTPSWGGFMSRIFCYKIDESVKSRILILPFTLGLPSDFTTLFSDLMYARSVSNMNTLFVTFDQPLYIKAIKIIYNFPDLFKKSLIKLGEFHLIMSYLGCIGYIMSGSGLKDLWSTVFAECSIVHMFSGHAYSRSLAAHLSTMVALFHNIKMKSSNVIADPDLESLKSLLKKVEAEDSDYSKEIVDNQSVMYLSDTIETTKELLKSQSLTSHLWITYFEMVSLLQLFIASIRLGDMELYQYCLSKMIPVFHAAGHFNYAKCARLYLQDLQESKNWMLEEDYEKFISEGRAVIRRFDKKWGGNEADKCIEQDLMRLIKSRGGLTRGRGITDSTMERFTGSLPATVPICESLETFCNITSGTSEQHKDLRSMSLKKVGNTNQMFVEWFSYHPPFPEESNALINISNGVVAAEIVNCYKVFEVGFDAACKIDDVVFSDVKLSNKDKVVTMSINNLVIRDKVVDINPLLLFHRICCVIESREEMEEYLNFELTQQPPSLFKEGIMRKGKKSELGKSIKSSIIEVPFKGKHAVVDGGHFLFSGNDWVKNSTFSDICQSYIDRLIGLHLDITVVFDGYDASSSSTKTQEQQRRSKGSASKTYVFDGSMRLQVSKKAFLSNYENKKRLINMLKPLLLSHGISVMQALADADYFVAKMCLDVSTQHSVWCVAVDTDILVMLVEMAQTSCKGIYFGKTDTSCYDVLELKIALPPEMSELVLIAHAISDNDTTSAFYKKGKKTVFDLIKKDCASFQYLKELHRSNCQHEEVASIIERFLITLYKGTLKKEIQNLDALRYELYVRIIGKSKLTSDFDLAVLPPTSCAARQHAFRVYHTLQQWKGIYFDPCKWGWRKDDNGLKPVFSTKPPIPEKLANKISCGCEKGCGNNCGCRKIGKECSVICKHCSGVSCLNSRKAVEEEN